MNRIDLLIGSIMICLLTLYSCQNAKSTPAENTQSQINVQITCIERVIAKDGALGKIRNIACKDIPLSQAITNYTNAMGQLDYSGCPNSFKKAFIEHRNAWMGMTIVTDHYPDLRGDMHTLFDSLAKGEHASQFKYHLQGIWDTWEAVESASK